MLTADSSSISSVLNCCFFSPFRLFFVILHKNCCLSIVNVKQIILFLAILMLCNVETEAQEHHRLTNLPHLYINTFTGNDVTSKTTQVWARMWMVDEDDNTVFYDSITIRGRGNSTWNLSKKPYRIKLATKTRLLGEERANAKKWTLLANHGDKTMFRNALASYIAELCGQTFAPAAKFVDLTLNGNYLGCYQISDQIEVRKKRVDVEEQDFPLTDDSNITGGYLVEADGFKDFIHGVSGWYTNRGVPMTIHYPDDEEIDARQLNYIRQFVNDFESRLFSYNYKDPLAGYRAVVDSTSLVSWYLASEISANPDYVWSLYFYKQRDDDHLFFGPLWDNDIAFNNDNRLSDTTTRLMADVAFANNGMEKWVGRMWEDEWFQRLVFNNYTRIYKKNLEEKLLEKIDSLDALLQESQQLNYQKWNIRTRYLREVILYSTYEEYVDDLRRFISSRLHALLMAFAYRQPDDVDIDEYDKVTAGFNASPSVFYAVANAGTNTVFDVDGNGRVVANSYDDQSHSQQWQIVTLQNGYQQLVNRMNGMALADPTMGETTETTNLGTQLAVNHPDSTDKSQQWHIVEQETNWYNLNNRGTRHTANLNGGNMADGTSIISYANDSRNSISNNRKWTFMPVDSIAVEKGDGGIRHTPFDYALAYDPVLKYLHFGADDKHLLSFNARVYDPLGRLVLQFLANDGASIGHLPNGTYVVSWDCQGRHSVKFLKQ